MIDVTEEVTATEAAIDEAKLDTEVKLDHSDCDSDCIVAIEDTRYAFSVLDCGNEREYTLLRFVTDEGDFYQPPNDGWEECEEVTNDLSEVVNNAIIMIKADIQDAVDGL